MRRQEGALPPARLLRDSCGTKKRRPSALIPGRRRGPGRTARRIVSQITAVTTMPDSSIGRGRRPGSSPWVRCRREARQRPVERQKQDRDGVVGEVKAPGGADGAGSRREIAAQSPKRNTAPTTIQAFSPIVPVGQCSTANTAEGRIIHISGEAKRAASCSGYSAELAALRRPSAPGWPPAPSGRNRGPEGHVEVLGRLIPEGISAVSPFSTRR